MPGCLLGTIHTSFILHNCVLCHHRPETKSQLAHCQRSTVIGLCALRCVLQHFPVLLCLGKGGLPFLVPTSVDGQLDLANRRHRLEGEGEEEARVALIPSLSLLETASLAASECPLWLRFPLHGPLGF